MPRLNVSRFGSVDEDFEKWVRSILLECYEKIDVEMPDLIEVYLFENERQAKAYLRQEKVNLGIYTDLDEAFLTTHDAWRGIPRISICSETLNMTPPKVRIGALQHEAAHSILHGSVEYYLVAVPDLRDSLKRRLPSAFTQNIAYLASVAVKDYQVTKLLYEKGFIVDQVAFTNYFLKPSDEEMIGWKIASTSQPATILFLASLMKSIACAMPLSDDEKWGSQINDCITSYTDYLPKEQKSTLFDIMSIFGTLASDFHSNIRVVLGEILKVLDASYSYT